MKEKIKKHYKFILGIVVGLVLSSLVAYAATAVASKDITYDNSKSGLSATNVNDALDETYEKVKTHCPDGYICSAYTVEVGDYVQMTPSSTAYTIDTSMTGASSSATINPSELNLWRVIKINDDNTVDMVSEYVSSKSIFFQGPTGYQNYVGTLNTIAKQYENSNYTVGSRHMGYDSTQTEYITDTSALTATTAPYPYSTGVLLPYSSSSALEARGLGDVGYETDYDLVNTALGTLVANQVGTTTATEYWLASRYYEYSPQSSNNPVIWKFNGRSIDTSGYLASEPTYYYYSTTLLLRGSGEAVRPIVTLKAGITPSSGNGSSENPYVLD